MVAATHNPKQRDREQMLRVDRVRVAEQRIVHESSRSLTQYLGNVVIDSRPNPCRWSDVWEGWQGDIAAQVVPAIEQACGMRSDYSGPTRFLYVLPRGHDKTGLIGRIANGALAFSRRKIRIAVAASVKDQARLLAKSMDDEQDHNPWLKQRIETYRNEIRSKITGSTQEVLSSDDGAASGRKDDIVILDEWTFWEDRELFDVLLSGVEKRPGSVFIIITNAGMRGSWQHKFLNDVRHDLSWLLYQSPVGKQLASWMDHAAIERLKSRLRPGFARRVIDNEWIDATETPLLRESAIRACFGSCLWSPTTWRADENRNADLCVGVDFGRTVNRTVIWVVQNVGGVAATRHVKVLHNVPFAEQEREIRSLCEDRRVRRVLLDKGAQGWTTTENLERDFPRKCEGVHLSGDFRGRIAMGLSAAFEDRSIEIPDSDPEMVADLQRVSQVETVAGKPRLKVDESADGMHADYFWAAALAVEAAELREGGAVAAVTFSSVR